MLGLNQNLVLCRPV